MAKEEKLDWIYKGANSLVDREDYLLGRKIDKPLEQLNEEEKEKKFVLPTPKNHVEHECIPPSIRDFNKIVQAEQVDLSAKLQEDPLVAIKKREEEARRQFLQNPVQLKKLQEALKKQEMQRNKHKKSRKKHSDDLDEKIKEKLSKLKSNPLGMGMSKKGSKKEKDEALNTILMHKFNALKDKLSEDDLQDILNGKISDSSDEEKPKKKKRDESLSNSDNEQKRRRSRDFNRKDKTYFKQLQKYDIPDKGNKRKRSRSNSTTRDYRSKSDKKLGKRRSRSQSPSRESRKDNSTNERRKGHRESPQRYKRISRSRSSSTEVRWKNHRESPQRYKRRSKSRSSSREVSRRHRSRSKERYQEKNKPRQNNTDKEKYEKQKSKRRYNSSEEINDRHTKINDKRKSSDEDSDLDRKIMTQLRLLRGEFETDEEKPSHSGHKDNSGSDSSSSDSSEDTDNKTLKGKYEEKKQKYKSKNKGKREAGNEDSEYERKIMAQLRLLRGEVETETNPKTLYPEKPPHLNNKNDGSSDSSERESTVHKKQSSKKPKKSRRSSSSEPKYKYSDSEEEKPQTKSFGLVTSEGKKIAFKKTEDYKKTDKHLVKKIEAPLKPERKQIKKMSEEEKERLRREMMLNAKTRDKEREENVKRYKVKDKNEEEMVSKRYDPDVVHTELLKAAKISSVEQRIKSKLNNIQRSSRHMDQNFSKR